jgi:hypothetical protein
MTRQVDRVLAYRATNLPYREARRAHRSYLSGGRRGWPAAQLGGHILPRVSALERFLWENGLSRDQRKLRACNGSQAAV